MFSLSPGQIRQLRGFGQPVGVDAYVFEPDSVDEICSLFDLAKSSGRTLSFAGAGRSYGDPMMTPEGLVASLRHFKQIEFAGESCARVGGGVTLEELWQWALPRGFWPMVVSGTAKTTVAGAIAMNIHGKNAFKAGTIGENLGSLLAVTPQNGAIRLESGDGMYRALIGGAGLFGAIVEAEVRMQPVTDGGLVVSAASHADWKSQFDWFEQTEGDYKVGWVDVPRSGRGVTHVADYRSTHLPLDPAKQLPPSTSVRAQGWRALALMMSPLGISFVNSGRYHFSRIRRHPEFEQSLAAFNFLLDSLPGWERAYGPAGLLQFQAFVPRLAALELFRALAKEQINRGIRPTLGVLKQHRRSVGVLDYSVDGFSLAMDFRREQGLLGLVHEMTEMVIDHGGKLYLAKDSSLTAEQFRRMHGDDAISRFIELKQRMDPDSILGSNQSRRLGLT